jgi:hypothetical protein
MQPLNAIDAVAPAFTRTHQTLFRPFRFGRSWKLAASQYLGWAGSMFIPFPLFLLLIPKDAFPGFAAARPVLLVVNVVITLVALVVLYFCARMELVSFEMMVTRGKFIAPMWRRYAVRIWPWLGLKVLVGTVYTALVAAAFAAPVRHLAGAMMTSLPLLNSVPSGGQVDPQQMQELLGPMVAQWIGLEFVFVLFAFVLKIPSTLLNDFVLPFFVLEDIPLLAALRRGLHVFAADPLQVLLYLVLKPILFTIGYVMQSVAISVGLIPVILVLAIGAGVTAALTPHSAGAGLPLVALGVVAYVGFAGLMIYVTLFVTGYLLALLEAYGIYFLAGRYPLLASMLEDAPDKPFTPPPVFPSDEERRDEDDGPPMPMNPAVA